LIELAGEILATCSSTYSPVRTSQEAHSVSTPYRPPQPVTVIAYWYCATPTVPPSIRAQPMSRYCLPQFSLSDYRPGLDMRTVYILTTEQPLYYIVCRSLCGYLTDRLVSTGWLCRTSVSTRPSHFITLPTPPLLTINTRNCVRN
jgi:hypothetical protein